VRVLISLDGARFRNRPHRAARALGELRGAFSFLMMTKSCVMAARDPHGFRPLSIGRIGDGWVFASETCALRQTGANFVRDIEPGELVIVDETGLQADSLGYLSVNDLLAPFGCGDNFCAACFDGKYPMPVGDMCSKDMLEAHSQHLQLDL